LPECNFTNTAQAKSTRFIEVLELSSSPQRKNFYVASCAIIELWTGFLAMVMSQWMLWSRHWRRFQVNDFWRGLNFGWTKFANFEQENRAGKRWNKWRQVRLVLKVRSWPWIRQPAICNFNLRMSELTELVENIGRKLWVESYASWERQERRVYFSKTSPGVNYFLEWRAWSLIWNTIRKFSLEIAHSKKDYTC
jgi:hypothetical protein